MVLCIGLLAGAAAWEARALEVLEAASGMVVLKRCVDVDDLMGSATTGQLDVCVVAAEVLGLDVQAVAHLRRHGVQVVGVVGGGHPDLARERLGQVGVRAVTDPASLDQLPALLRALTGPVEPAGQAHASGPHSGSVDSPGPEGSGAAPVAPGPGGQVLAVWGPVGAPGRTTVAAGLAGLLAARGRAVVVVDADPNAALAQHLGVLDQVSGLLSAARLQVAGTLPGRVQSVCRALGPRLGVLTGLPRPDRRDEVLAGTLPEVLGAIAAFADVVVDLGSDLHQEAVPGAPGAWTPEVLEAADSVLVVGAADPVGLTRLAHALMELREATGGVEARVVVNRTRPTLGWSEREMAEVVGRLVPVHSLHFLPDDQTASDRALVAGEPVGQRPSALATALEEVLDAVRPDTVADRPVRRQRGARPGRRGTPDAPDKPSTQDKPSRPAAATARPEGPDAAPDPVRASRGTAPRPRFRLRTTGTARRR